MSSGLLWLDYYDWTGRYCWKILLNIHISSEKALSAIIKPISFAKTDMVTNWDCFFTTKQISLFASKYPPLHLNALRFHISNAQLFIIR